ncbi:MAG: malto-oligosyltrehalose trehalohydrolase [Burkholderiales bacterium]|nr:MAG: malto-oligosyltrehalose trehalohydrolase [Burkholderiales bacterium]
MRRAHAMPFGASLRADAGARFRLWAPGRDRIDLELVQRAAGTQARAGASIEVAGRVAMTRSPGGWHEADVREATAGSLYRFRLDDGLAVPDPASRFNPLDVHGPSELLDPLDHDWSDGGWTGRPWHEAVVYELHVGAFTPAGTFDAARERLAELALLGITAVELMPVADFPGARNWGYDGVLPYAPDASYGRPEHLKRFVEAAHSLGIMVLLDVVYNHFGPDGNYLHAYAPQFFDPARRTPWGAAIDFDGPSSATVRDFFVHNALFWICEYGFDGLRIDAVHAIEDRSSPDIVESIALALRDGPGRERFVHLVLENDRNEAHYLAREVGDAAVRPRQADAQWNDDIHHALHVLLTGETDGYYADYADTPVERLGRALAEGFVYQGDASAFRDGARRGEPSAHLPPSAFVAFLQTHDQVGNRAFGGRIDAVADPALMPAALACVLLGPQVPLLFMGEEYAASTPFLFFCDFGPELAAAVRDGRREEFGRFQAFRDPAARAAIPDPNAIETFSASKLRWRERDTSPHRERLALVRQLLQVRHALMPMLGRIRHGGRWFVTNGPRDDRPDATLDATPGAALGVRWDVAGRAAEAIALHVNFGARPIEVGTGAAEVAFSHASGPGSAPGRWTLARGGVLLALERGDA